MLLRMVLEKLSTKCNQKLDANKVPNDIDETLPRPKPEVELHEWTTETGVFAVLQQLMGRML